MKIPNSLIPEAYSFSKKVFEKKLSLKEAQNHLVGDNRINPNSAADYFNDFRYLMQGMKFARTLNAFSMDYFISSIYKDYGIDGLQNALKALKLHIKYYEELQKTTMYKMREIYEKYSSIHKNEEFFSEIVPIHSHIKNNHKFKTTKQLSGQDWSKKQDITNYSGKNFLVTNFEEVVKDYKSKITPEHRYASYDYCYNYFLLSTPDELTKDIEKGCFTLGFYLASWGMLRPSSFLLNKSAKYYASTIHYIASLDKTVWKIDVDSYPDNMDIILNIYTEVRNRLIKNGNADLTLVTKILLGVFGFIPAYDNYFCSAFREISGQDCRFRKVDKNSLELLHMFYLSNKSSIDRLSSEIFTIDFLTGYATKNSYTKAKIIDMYGFTSGQLNVF